jgi:hypothetical protein
VFAVNTLLKNGRMIAADAECTDEIKSDDTMVKAGFDKKKILFTSKLDLSNSAL